jgi:hypothetical protein
MRQGQQSRRGRGRGRKVQNPLARNFESNGPDVKIRGTAAHIAEKYSTLARDAAASGDSVQAENYLQHAEHYNRIIMAAQAQASPNAQPAGEGANGSGGQRHRRQQGGDDGGRGGDDAFVNGEDMDEAGEPAQQAETAASDRPSGESGGGKRRRSNGGDSNGGGKGADDDAQPSAEDTDSVTA